MDNKNIGKAIQKSAKKVIAESGIGSSRSGNKELSHLATRLSHQPVHSLANAQVLGARLGKKIVELSQASSKHYLDKGIIRTLVVTKAIPSVADLPTATASVNGLESKTRQTSKGSSPVASLPPVEPVQPTVLPADEPDIEDETSATDTEFAEDITSSSVSSTQVVEETEEEDEYEEDEEDEDEDEYEEDEDEYEEGVAIERLEEPMEAIQAEDSTAPIALDAVDETIMAEDLDAQEELATEIV